MEMRRLQVSHKQKAGTQLWAFLEQDVKKDGSEGIGFILFVVFSDLSLYYEGKLLNNIK